MLKGIIKINNKNSFRVSLKFYNEAIVKLIFGQGKKEGAYIFFDSELSEEEIYKKFNLVLKEMFS